MHNVRGRQGRNGWVTVEIPRIECQKVSHAMSVHRRNESRVVGLLAFHVERCHELQHLRHDNEVMACFAQLINGVRGRSMLRVPRLSGTQQHVRIEQNPHQS